MVRPDLESFKQLAVRARAVPLVREVVSDLDTALAVFLKVDDHRHAFLFESNEGGEHWGRYSFIGLGARALFTARDGVVEIERGGRRELHRLASDRSEDPLDHLRRLLAELRPASVPDLPRFSGGAVGYVSYDWVRYVERLPERNPDPLGVPDCWFVFPETVLVHDRLRERLAIIHDVELAPGEAAEAAYERGVRALDRVEAALAAPAPRPAPPAASSAALEPVSNVSRERFVEMVKRCKEYIHAGDIFQVVPSQRMTLRAECDPLAIYRELRLLNPSPYLFFMRCGDHVVLGSSPEIHVRLTDGVIELRPLAGTAPRGATPEEDKAIEKRLLADPKELAEHVMLVDLGRNDVGRVAEIGSVVVDEFETVERYSHVMHIVSNVRGRLRADKDAVDLLRATFPAGTVSGAPKVRAMEIIEEVEPERRGLYAGCVGYFDYHGNMDTCIALRTMLAKDGKLYVQAGGGIVADSVPETEYQETLHKAGALLRAIALAGGAR
ncbi:MAG TPA: anthranilate synthase component I [Myxococcota bacterium]|nr:anthranilate synthase component I [Myxococcota bacterium]